MSEGPIHLVYVTMNELEAARSMGRTVVEEKLAACANIIPRMTSIYEWKGQIEEEEECLILLKVPRDREAALRARIVELHPYEVPAIVSWPLATGHEPFLDWVREQSRPPHNAE